MIYHSNAGRVEKEDVEKMAALRKGSLVGGERRGASRSVEVEEGGGGQR